MSREPPDQGLDLLAKKRRFSVVPKNDIGALNLLGKSHLRINPLGDFLLGKAFLEQTSPTHLFGAGDAHDEREAFGKILFEKERYFDDMMSRSIDHRPLAQTSDLGMGQSLKKNELSGITEDLSGDPATVGPAVGP